MEKINVYVMIGLPGAGKDTWIGNNLPNCKYVVSRDDIRIQLGMCGPGGKTVGNRDEEDTVTTIFNNKLKMYIFNALEDQKKGVKSDIVINNTNLTKWQRDAYKKLLANHYVNWIYVVITAPSIEDNIQRRDGQIDSEIIRRLAKRYQPPTPDEYDEIIRVNQ